MFERLSSLRNITARRRDARESEEKLAISSKVYCNELLVILIMPAREALLARPNSHGVGSIYRDT